MYIFFYLLCSSFFFSGFTFYKEALCFIIFILSLCSNMLNLENILEYIRQNFKKHAHFQISSQDEISSREKRVNSKRHFTIDRDDFIQGRVSSRDEISRVNTLLVVDPLSLHAYYHANLSELVKF